MVSVSPDVGRKGEKVDETEAGLRVFEEVLKKRVSDEEDRNDPGAPRIHAATTALETTRNALAWVRNPAKWRERSSYGRAKHDAKDWTSTATDDAKRAAKDVAQRFRR